MVNQGKVCAECRELRGGAGKRIGVQKGGEGDGREFEGEEILGTEGHEGGGSEGKREAAVGAESGGEKREGDGGSEGIEIYDDSHFTLAITSFEAGFIHTARFVPHSYSPTLEVPLPKI